MEPSIDELVLVEAPSLGRSRLAQHLRDLERAQARLDAARLAAVRAFDAATGPALDGAATTSGWLAHHTGVARSTAARRARLAALAPDMPIAHEALFEGRITADHLHVLARCTGHRTVERWRVDEPMLVASAERLEADQLAKAVAYWLSLADTDGTEPPSGRDDGAWFSRTTAGRGVLHADLGAESADELEAALATKYDELWRADRAAAAVDPTDPIALRTPAERRAAALMALVELGAGADDRLTERRRPSVTLIADHRTAVGAPTATPVHETERGQVVVRRRLQQMLCDASAAVVVLGSDGEPISLGRSTRVPSAAQRRAVVARDRGCAVPGCHRPPGWCDAHHIQPWAAGGSTDLSNLVLLCRHHHTRVHQGHLTIERAGDRIRWLRADGTEVPDPRSSPRIE